MKTKIKSLVIILAGALIFNACVKKEAERDDDTESASENFLASSIGNDMGNIADEAGRTNNVSSFKTTGETMFFASCATLKYDTLNHANPDSITVNFGAVNCLCNDGRNRRGSLLITYTGKYRDSLTTVSIVPINYFVNDNKVEGSKTVKNLGHQGGVLVHEINENLTVTKANGSGVITFTAKRERRWAAGESTLIWSDDVYHITGTASGTNANGRTFVSNITKKLVRDMSLSCRKYFISGTIDHTPSNKATRTIDFGDGACDNKATVSINGNIKEIELP